MKYTHFACLAVWGCLIAIKLNAQPYTASFIGRMGIDTVLVETYTMINNHLFGKVFTRVPEDYVREFSIHFYPDGSIREFFEAAMNPFNPSVPLGGKISYAYNRHCVNDTCTFYLSQKEVSKEKIIKHAAQRMDFVGGWTPVISLMEWNCLRLAKSNKQSMPLTMINYLLGVYPIGISYLNKDTVIFGGPFIDYTKIMIGTDGRIISTNGTGTPWNYTVTKHEPIDIDLLARRMAKTKGIGDPSPEETLHSKIKDSNIELNYRRPYKRGRKIFGGIVPYDSIWRTGAGSATTLSLSNDIRIGQIIIPKGKYSLYTIPRKNEWTLIFNQDLNRWPTDPNRSKDFASVIIPVTKNNDLKDQFTIEITETKKGGIIKFQWDDTVALSEFLVVKK